MNKRKKFSGIISAPSSDLLSFITTLVFILISLNYDQSSIAEARDEDIFSFDQPVLRGTGCPAGTTSIVLSPDQTSISILFDRFEAQVPNQDGQNDNGEISDDNPRREAPFNPRLDHKVCYLQLGANLPQNFHLVSLDVSVDFRGHTYVEKGSRAIFKSSYMETKGLGHNHRPGSILESKVWEGTSDQAINEDWTIQTKKIFRLPPRCARAGDRKVNMHLKNVLTAAVHRNNLHAVPIPTSIITMDSTDIVGMIKVKLHIRSCQGGVRSGR